MPQEPPTTWHPPRTHRGSPSATPRAVLAALLAAPAPNPAGTCTLCRRRIARDAPRRIAPTSPSLAALIPPGPLHVALCRRCSRAPAVKSLLAREPPP
jgi:hypothetical protein